jgi:4-diphosphocytidyl-2-C-methyl-D-erythritol kinase
MQLWNVKTSKSGWFTATTSRFFGADLPRIFSMFNDPASWPVEPPHRLLKTETNLRLGYTFANQSRVELSFDAIRPGLYRVGVFHEHLHNSAELAWAQTYWDTVLQNVFQRLLCEPVVAATAFGKINMFFRVGPLLENGYHQVASLYQSVDLAETVVVELDGEWSVSAAGPIGADHLAAVPTDTSNLVVKAAKALAKAAGIKKPIPLRFALHKTVPVAGGMGGGSADAAAAILAVEKVWHLELSKEVKLAAAASLGADVPFALLGGSASGLGVGDDLKSINQTSELHWVLVPSDFGLSTPSVFAELDRIRTKRNQDPTTVKNASMSARLTAALRAGASAEEIAPLLHNDLQEAAVSLRPELQQILDLEQQVFALRAIVSGSGPTIAFLARDANDAITIASRLRTYGQQAIVTSSPAGAAQLVN